MAKALILVGKAPVPGATKTRLVPPLTALQAAALYRGFLLDAVHLGLALGWERVCVVHPEGGADILRELLPSHVRTLEQPGVGLGDALSFAFAHHFGEGFATVVLIGSDNPTLGSGPIEAADAALARPDDLAIGPTTDGGYYLIGMRRPTPMLFEAIDWSTPRVYAQTLSRARDAGLRVHCVEEWYDVDEPLDLERLQRDLASGDPTLAPNTRAVLPKLSVYAAGPGGTRSVGLRPDRSA